MNTIDNCSECGNRRKIVNKKHYLCDSCNFTRLHPGMTYGTYLSNKVSEKKKEERAERVASMKLELTLKNPLISVVKYCTIPGCLKEAKSKGKCSSHFRIASNNKRKRGITKQASTERSVKAELSKLKKVTKEKYAEENGGTCEGCLKSTGGLQYSHIISVGQRKDLELKKGNHNMLCQSCHDAWESYDPERLLKLAVFYPNMEFIREHDTKKFWVIYYKFNDSMMFDVCKKLEEIDDNYTLKNK